MTTTEKLLDRAQREVTRRALLHGEDWQAIVNDILNDKVYAQLFEGLSEDETFDLCQEISHGSDDLELELLERGELE